MVSSTPTNGTSAAAKPIFLATHPRSCSTAFERVFMNRKDLTCEHEPFGEAWYYGPERLSPRYEGADNKAKRDESGHTKTTFAETLKEMERRSRESGNRLFIKDMAQYLIPPPSHPSFRNAQPAPSVTPSTNEDAKTNGHTKGTLPKNPTVLPLSILRQFHFTFLIRHPRRAIPSYYRCCIPPLSSKTGFEYFSPAEAGFRELRELFEYLIASGLLEKPSDTNGTGNMNGEVRNGGETSKTVCVIDADDLLDHPKEVVEGFCNNVGLSFDPGMLEWEAGDKCDTFDKWAGFHEDAIESSGLKAREGGRHEKSREEEYESWVEKYGKEGARIIEETAEGCMEDYEFLRQYKMRV